MVLQYVTGNLLSDVLDAAGGIDGKALVDLGAEVGRVFAAIATVAFGRPGFLSGGIRGGIPGRVRRVRTR